MDLQATLIPHGTTLVKTIKWFIASRQVHDGSKVLLSNTWQGCNGESSPVANVSHDEVSQNPEQQQ